jgi:DNA-binding GntR family transcriptional regulator
VGVVGTRLWNRAQPYRRDYKVLVDANNLGIVHSEHHMLVTALRDGVLDLAEQIVTQHSRRTRLHVERHPEVFVVQADHTN